MMEDRDEDLVYCRVCGRSILEKNHNNSVNHKFQLSKYLYNRYRKALSRDRHGVTLTVENQANHACGLQYIPSRGKYLTNITSQQLRSYRNVIIYNCCIKNNTTNSIYIMNLNLLHTSHNFSMNLRHRFGEQELTFLNLRCGQSYNWTVEFFTNVLSSASYKIPITCDLQTENKKRFTIARSFLVIVDNPLQENVQLIRSPFTSKPWTGIIRTLDPVDGLKQEDHFPVPKNYLHIFRRGLKTFDGITIDQQDIFHRLSQVTTHLRKDNYSAFWDIVLWLEEVAQSIMLMKYNMEEVTVEMSRDEILILEVPGLGEKRPSVVKGDFIKMRLSGDHTAYKGRVTRVTDTTVEISHLDDELLDYLREDPSTPVDVSFMGGRLAFERMHHAVHVVERSGYVERLFPDHVVSNRARIVHDLRAEDFYDTMLRNNVEQREAVMKILNSTQTLPYIVFGPPGTGKTITIVEAILQLKKRTKKKILVCAPANSACDLLATKLIPHMTRDELIRIHSSTRETDTIKDDLLDYSNIIEGEITAVPPPQLVSYRVVVTTLVLIGRYNGSYHPDVVFVDEAAQASEPETAIALALLKDNPQVVLAGDPKQLGPMATDRARELGLGTSLLERLMNYDVYRYFNANFITMLRVNYRSHPDILEIPNDLFYSNNLQPRSVEAVRDPIIRIALYPVLEKGLMNSEGRAVEFCSVSGRDKREGSSPSYFNMYEVKMVVKYIQTLIALNLSPVYKVRADQIGVVTPYKRQMVRIHEKLKQLGLEDVEVGTTESFQGREKRIILISTVRAQHSLLRHDKKYNLGFVKNDQRFNVALTRAISKLIVIGCPLVLRTDSKWQRYMEMCAGYRTYFGTNFERQDDTFKRDVIRRTARFNPEDDQYRH